jgi:hypothetical protein
MPRIRHDLKSRPPENRAGFLGNYILDNGIEMGDQLERQADAEAKIEAELTRDMIAAGAAALSVELAEYESASWLNRTAEKVYVAMRFRALEEAQS